MMRAPTKRWPTRSTHTATDTQRSASWPESDSSSGWMAPARWNRRVQVLPDLDRDRPTVSGRWRGKSIRRRAEPVGTDGRLGSVCRSLVRGALLFEVSMELTPRNAKVAERTGKRSMVTLIMLGLLFVGWVGEWPLEIDPVMYHGLWRSPFAVLSVLFASIPGISLFPWQILLIVLAPFCLGSASGERRHSREMDRAILVSITCMAVTFLWGLARGGSAYYAYYQIWRFLAALAIGYMLMSVLRGERDVASLGKAVVLAALIRATLCIYFYWAYIDGKIYPAPEYVTNHDDSMLWVVATLIVSVWACVKRGRAAVITAALVTPYLFYAMILNTRRIAWVELGLALPLFYFLIGSGPLRSRINKWLIRIAPLGVIYFVVGLGSDSAVFAPVHALA